jgi:hypothetical protein
MLKHPQTKESPVMSEAECLIRELVDLLDRFVAGRRIGNEAGDLLNHVEDWLRRQSSPMRPFTVIKGGRR